MASKSKAQKSSDKPSGSGEPQTMEELMAKYGGVVHGYSIGDKVKGTVLEKTSKRLILDIGGKSEGIVAERAFNEAQSFIKGLAVGDIIEGTVIVPETPDGFTILSLRNASESSAWEKLERAVEEGDYVVVEGRAVTPSGIMVDFESLTGFIPNSQLGRDVSKNTTGLVGKHFKVAVIDIDRQTNKIVLSERAVSEAEDIQLQEKAYEEVKEGKRYEGEVTTVYDFGVFVRIHVPMDGDIVPLEGLVHISELSWDKIVSPKNVMKPGEKVSVVSIGKKDGKLAFSIKQTKTDPWEDIDKKYVKDAKVKGKVVRVSDFGVFVQLEPGVEGLIHMTKIPPGKKFAEGDEADVYIEEVDKQNRKISLGLVLTAKPVGYR